MGTSRISGGQRIAEPWLRWGVYSSNERRAEPGEAGLFVQIGRFPRGWAGSERDAAEMLD